MWNSNQIAKTISCCSIAMLLISSAEAAIFWSAPADISASGKNAVASQVASEENKNATLVWSRSNGSNFIVQTSTGKIGGKWALPTNLSQNGQNGYFAKIATDNSGNATSVWSRFNGTNYIIQASQKNFNGSWTSPVNLSYPGAKQQDATQPQIAVEPQGYAVVVWQKFDGVNNIIQAAHKKVGATWIAPQNLSISHAGGRGDITPQVQIDNEKNAYVVWLNDSTSTVFAAMRPFNGLWSTPVSISASGNVITNPNLTIGSNGQVSAIWSRFDGSNYVVQSASLASNGHWSAPVNLSVTGGDAITPQLDADSHGNIAAIWQRFDGVNTIIEAAIQLAGGSWQPPVDISEAGQDASEPQICIDDSGNIQAVWKRSDGSNFIIQASSASVAASTWSTPVSLSAAGEDAISPQMTINSDGNIIVTWQRSNGANSIIQATFGVIPK